MKPLIPCVLVLSAIGFGVIAPLTRNDTEAEEQKILASLYRKEEESYIRRKILTKITDQVTLKEIVRSEPSSALRVLAADRLRRRSLAQAMYMDIVLKGEYPSEVRTAFENLNDQSSLTNIAKNAKSDKIRVAAAIRLKNKIFAQSVYKDIIVKQKDPYARRSALRNLTDQKLLAKIAKNAWESANRLAALENLTEESALREIGRDDPVRYIREVAESKLTDQVVLRKIAKNGIIPEARIRAADKLEEQALAQSVYIEIARDGDDFSLRFEGMKRMSDQVLLAELLLNEANRYMSPAILEQLKLTDQEALANIAKNARDHAFRVAAFAKLADQAKIADILKNHFESSIHGSILEELNDTTVLTDLAKHALDVEVRSVATGKLTSQAVLADVAKNDPENRVREIAMSRLTDQTVLADIAKSDPKWHFRQKAVAKLTDQAVLVDIAKKDPEWRVRHGAVKRITDQLLLAKIAQNDTDIIIRNAAIEQLTDQALLLSIAQNDPDAGVRANAVSKLTDQETLRNFAQNDTSDMVRRRAIFKITDQALLLDFAKNDKHEQNRLDAAARLDDKVVSEPIIVEIARNGEYTANRMLAMHLLMARKATVLTEDTNFVQSVYADIAMKDFKLREGERFAHQHSLGEFQRHLIRYVTDQSLLESIARNGKDVNFCGMAALCLTDKKVLEDIVENETDGYVRMRAKERLAQVKAGNLEPPQIQHGGMLY